MQSELGMRHATKVVGLLLGLACGPALAGSKHAATAAASTQPSKFRVGTISDPAIPESSGIVASRKHEGVYWTQNDSGNPPALFAITREGELIREYPVGAKNVDWED